MNSKKHQQIKESWERRSKIFGDKKEAVMHQSLPTVMNNYIHQLHTEEILRHLPRRGCMCLDIGCGYGRLATEVIARNKEAYVYGVDISTTFVNLFNKNVRDKGKAVVGDIRKLPYENNSFDFVYCVVTLMYLEKFQEQKKAIQEIIRVLRPGGIAVIIEPNSAGNNIIILFGFLPFILRRILGRKKVETFGTTFPWRRIDRLVKESGASLFEKRGYTFFTIFFLPVLILAKISSQLADIALGLIYRLDKVFPFARFSYFISYQIIK